MYIHDSIHTMKHTDNIVSVMLEFFCNSDRAEVVSRRMDFSRYQIWKKNAI